MAYDSKYTGAEVEALLDKVNDGGGGGGYSYWNYYFFEGSSAGDSVVTIDGNNVTVPANTIVEGNFTDDITAIGTNNLKRIITRGDITLNVCTSSSSANTTLEEVDMEFSKSFERSFEYTFYNLQGLKRLRVAGSVPTSYACTFYYIGAATEGGCDVDIKGMDLTQNVMTDLFNYAKIISLDVSGCRIRCRGFLEGATVGSVNASGCVFHTGNVMLTLGACFYYSTIGSLNLEGADFTEARMQNAWGYNNIGSININGVKLPNNSFTSPIPFINSLCGNYVDDPQIIGGITGSLGNSTIPADQQEINITNITLDRQSILVIFSSLAEATLEQMLTGTASITLSSENYAALTEYDIAVATNRNWIVTV